MVLPVTSLYAGLLGVLFIALSIGVIRLRRRLGKAFGAEGDAELTRRVRAHGNFAEYVPLLLLFLALLEIQNAPLWALHLFGTLILGGRLLHAYSVRIAEPQQHTYIFRMISMLCTFGVLLMGALALLWKAV